jgi:hypothetical protein
LQERILIKKEKERIRLMSRIGYWFSAFLILTLAVTACSQQSGSKQVDMQQQMKNMTQKMAMDSQVQRAFLKGREFIIQKDNKLRKEIFNQNLREQKGMLSDPDLFLKMADMNIDLTRKTLNTPGNMQDRLLETNLETIQKIKASPTKRNQLIKALQQARDDAMKDKQMKNLLLKKGMDEHYLALNTPAVTPMVLDYTLDVQDRIMMSPFSKKRMLKSQMKSLKAMAGDPEIRPQLVAFMIQLMKDPAMQKEMQKMMMQMMRQQMQMMQSQMSKSSGKQSVQPMKQSRSISNQS